MSRTLRSVLPLVALALIGAGCLRVRPRIVQAPTPTPAPQAEASALAFLRLDGGAATVVRNGEGKPGVDEVELESGDRVKVTSGPVSIVYPDKGETQLDAGSDVTLLGGDGNTGGLFAELRLAAGRAWTRFESLFGSGEQFSVAANGVVATVRGTAFGVAVMGDDVDIQVAEHAVEVAEEATDVSAATSAANVVKVDAGEGITLRAAAFASLDAMKLAALKRKLTDAEKGGNGYRFALRRLDAARLMRPAVRRKLFSSAPILTSDLQKRQFFLRQMMLQRLQNSGFVAPTRGVIQTETAPTNVAPSVTGPTQ